MHGISYPLNDKPSECVVEARVSRDTRVGPVAKACCLSGKLWTSAEPSCKIQLFGLALYKNERQSATRMLTFDVYAILLCLRSGDLGSDMPDQAFEPL